MNDIVQCGQCGTELFGGPLLERAKAVTLTHHSDGRHTLSIPVEPTVSAIPADWPDEPGTDKTYDF